MISDSDLYNICHFLSVKESFDELKAQIVAEYEESKAKEIVQQIRQHTLKTMKPEMAPWAKNYTPKMEDIQTKLRIIHPDQSDNKDINDYKELFVKRAFSRILVKGGWGSGKTMLSKKLAFDWASGTFSSYFVVFVVPSKLIRSTASIEQVLAQYYSGLGLNIAEESLEQLFKKLRRKILVIIDGSNDDVPITNLEHSLFLFDNYYSDFSVIVTTGGPVTQNLKEIFQMVCEMRDLYPEELKPFLSGTFKNVSDVKPVPNFDIDISDMFNSSNGINPMIAMFLCFLRENNQLDADYFIQRNHQFSVWEIFLKLVMTLTNRNFTALKSIGEYAFGHFVKKTSPKTCPNLTHYHDLGLLIADSSDGSFNFPHSTVRLFFGTLYFILMLDEGKSVESLVGPDSEQPVFLMNSLFLYFCLGLLSDQNQLPLSRKEQIYQDLKGYVLRFVDYVQVDLDDVRTVFPALGYCFGDKTQNQIGSKYINDVFSACQNIKVLVHSPDFVTDQILQSMLSSLPNLNSVLLLNNKELIHNEVSNEHDFWYLGEKAYGGESEPMLNVVFQNQSADCAEDLLLSLREHKRKLNVRFNHCHMSKPIIELGSFTKANVKQLHFYHSIYASQFLLCAGNDLVIACPQLTHLTFNEIEIEEEVLSSLSKSVHGEHLPNLKYLSFRGCEGALQSRLGLLFEFTWPRLIHLDVSKCLLDSNDLMIICTATNSSLENKLPRLTSLAISPNDATSCTQDEILVQPWVKLEALSLVDIPNYDSVFVKALGKGLFPSLKVIKVSEVQVMGPLPRGLHSLTFNVAGKAEPKMQTIARNLSYQDLFHLDLSCCQLSGGLKYIVRHKLSSLKTFVLRRCNLISEDLQLLSQADEKNNFPNLKSLDIVGNSANKLNYLLESKWKTLQNLNVDWDNIFKDRNLEFIMKSRKEGGLCSLRKLVFHTRYNLSEIQQEKCWTCKQFRIDRTSSWSEITNLSAILRPIANSLDKVPFPSLTEIHVCTMGTYADDAYREKLRLRKHNISVYLVLEKRPSLDCIFP